MNLPFRIYIFGNACTVYRCLQQSQYNWSHQIQSHCGSPSGK
uniref:Uncharacterized protein n=1 Tax=Anguilla anguilla TaxID=7936 RepID=A0A0E9S5K8_ANGAN